MLASPIASIKESAMKLVDACGVTLLLSAMLPALAADAPKTLHLASLEWLPFSGSALPNNGLSGAIVAEAAKQMGGTVKVDYFTWKDTVAKGEADPAFIGYFPVFSTEERTKKCYFSAPIGKAVTGIGYHKDAPVQWKTQTDLASLKIGVVDGYANGDAFDAAVKDGKQPVEVSRPRTASWSMKRSSTNGRCTPASSIRRPARRCRRPSTPG
jgi:polar amino acid transport system substrate-binding protein